MWMNKWELVYIPYDEMGIKRTCTWTEIGAEACVFVELLVTQSNSWYIFHPGECKSVWQFEALQKKKGYKATADCLDIEQFNIVIG